MLPITGLVRNAPVGVLSEWPLSGVRDRQPERAGVGYSSLPYDFRP